MEINAVRAKRSFKSEEEIKLLLEQQQVSGRSVKSFCDNNNLAYGSFQNWRKRYGKQSSPVGFVEVNVAAHGSAALFAEVNGIKIYQPVNASYLKELLP